MITLFNLPEKNKNNNKIIQRATGKHAIHINDIKEIGDE